ncbi:SRPBCC family protein [Streptomyces sp. NPDC059176]|uniref:SRPBCC family protein n=1 Tax=unclassified Streptomyces TaxID=2593676 RepID=UPI0036C8868B
MVRIGALVAVAAAGSGAAAGYLGLVTGAVPMDLGVGRRTRRLGPRSVDITAPRETVFEVITQPYLGRQTRAMREKVTVLEQGSDMVLAAHRTPVAGGRLTATTVETVRFTRPERVDFRLVRGPVPTVTETFALHRERAGTRLVYSGELGTDLWALGRWWGDAVAARWEATVAATLSAVKQEAERRAAVG